MRSLLRSPGGSGHEVSTEVSRRSQDPARDVSDPTEISSQDPLAMFSQMPVWEPVISQNSISTLLPV